MLKIKPTIKPSKCKFYYTKDKIEQLDSKCIKCGSTREYHKNELAYLLRRK